MNSLLNVVEQKEMREVVTKTHVFLSKEVAVEIARQLLNREHELFEHSRDVEYVDCITWGMSKRYESYITETAVVHLPDGIKLTIEKQSNGTV